MVLSKGLTPRLVCRNQQALFANIFLWSPQPYTAYLQGVGYTLGEGGVDFPLLCDAFDTFDEDDDANDDDQ